MSTSAGNDTRASVRTGASSRPGNDTRASAVTVTVCRGCCCGTTGKHPGFDHHGQVDRLRAAHDQVRTSKCLNACDQSNVVVVQPAPEARRGGARPVWLAGVLDAEVEARVVEWVRAGGPGVAPMPPALAARAFAARRWPRPAVRARSSPPR